MLTSKWHLTFKGISQEGPGRDQLISLWRGICIPGHSQSSTISTESCLDLMEANGLEIVSDVIVKLLTTCIILISDKVDSASALVFQNKVLSFC